jgi:hypothetical protein
LVVLEVMVEPVSITRLAVLPFLTLVAVGVLATTAAVALVGQASVVLVLHNPPPVQATWLALHQWLIVAAVVVDQ